MVMKKILYLLSALLCLSGINAFSQGIPNSGFEDWSTFTGNSSLGTFTYDLPNNWKTTDSVSYAFGITHSAVKETSIVHSGSAAIKLSGWSFLGNAAPGAASNGDIDVTTVSIIKGTPDTVRHARMLGYYQFSPVGGDTCFMYCAMMKYNTVTGLRDTIGFGMFSTTSAAGSYTPFQADISYASSATPDSMLILLTTSPLKLGSGHVGTTLYVDDLSFAGVVGVEELSGLIKNVDLYPSPASSVLNIRTELSRAATLTYRIFDSTGKFVSSDLLENGITTVDIRNLENGNYYLQLYTEKNERVYSSLFPVVK